MLDEHDELTHLRKLIADREIELSDERRASSRWMMIAIAAGAGFFMMALALIARML